MDFLHCIFATWLALEWEVYKELSKNLETLYMIQGQLFVVNEL